MSAKFEQRKARMMAMINSLEPSEKRDGKKKQRSQAVKLDRFQRNLTDAQSSKARGEFNYYSGGLWDKPQMYIG